MDGSISPGQQYDRAAIEAAARNMGIVPGDPAYPLIGLMLTTTDNLMIATDQVKSVPEEIRAEIDAAIRALDERARKPVSDDDIRKIVIGASRGAAEAAHALAQSATWRTILWGTLMAVVLLTLAFFAGWEWRASTPRTYDGCVIDKGKQFCYDWTGAVATSPGK